MSAARANHPRRIALPVLLEHILAFQEYTEMTEQLGVGYTGETKVIKGGLMLSGGLAANGVTAIPSIPTVNTASVATTTLANACLNGILLALKNAGIINSDAA